MIVGCGFLAPLVLVDRSWEALASASAVAWLALAYLTFATTLLAFFWWNIGIQRVGAGKTAIFSNLVPVFGVLLAWVVLGETLGMIPLKWESPWPVCGCVNGLPTTGRPKIIPIQNCRHGKLDQPTARRVPSEPAPQHAAEAANVGLPTGHARAPVPA
jgi:hypothetical protein